MTNVGNGHNEPSLEFTGRQARESLDEITGILMSWHLNRESDSVRLQTLRTRDMHIGSLMMERLVEGIQPERNLLLRVGDTTIYGTTFDKQPYGFSYEVTNEMQPNTRLRIIRTKQTGTREPSKEFYIGGYPLVVSLGEVARTLCERGELTLVTNLDLENS